MLGNAEIQPLKGQQKIAETRVPGKTSSPHSSHVLFKPLELDDNLVNWPGSLLPHHNFHPEF